MNLDELNAKFWKAIAACDCYVPHHGKPVSYAFTWFVCCDPNFDKVLQAPKNFDAKGEVLLLQLKDGDVIGLTRVNGMAVAARIKP